MSCRYPHFPAGLGLIYARKFVYRGWDFHLHEDRAALKVVSLLTLEMCTSQLCVHSRDFLREKQRLAEHPVPRDAQLIPVPHAAFATRAE